ncbi:MAG: peptidoglycan DD-metalloendopeptidase family protein [Ruminococcus sp.]|nr:peptidoglycan DD-metalloendopeptidase family protein [Ruminococcus sp.]
MKKSKRILSVLLSACMISVPFITAFPASAEESVSSLKQQLEELENQNQKYQDILDKTQKDINEKEEYSEALVNKIAVLNDKIGITHKSIDELNDDIDKKQKEINKGNEDIEEQIQSLCERLRTIYMAGNATDLEIIFGAKDFSDFIDKVQLIKALSNYDKKLINEVNEMLEKINEQKLKLEDDKSELEIQEASLQNDIDDLNGLIEENDAILRDLYSSSADAQSAIKELELESQEIDNQIKAYYAAQQEAAAAKAKADQKIESNNNSDNSNSSPTTSDNQSDEEENNSSNEGDNNTPSSGGGITSSGYTWPVPGFYYLSSEWNEDRFTYNHGAIDIAGSGIMGATVVAADSGTVAYSYSGCVHNWGKNGSCGCGGGYGNYVMIDHGNGKITIYAHLTSLAVGTGQYVSKGQTVGYVGSTGYSTGPHLHFECRLNGVKYNPMLEF